jgi:N-acetylglutamate synthase-like GNAT family acetyltransferase
MNYRKATPADLPAVRQLVTDSDQFWDIQREELEYAVVCSSGALVVGFASMEVLNHSAVGQHLLVHPGFRGMGIGRKISQFLFDEARDMGLQRVCFWSEDAEFFLRAQGLKPCSEDREEWLHDQGELPEETQSGKLLELVLSEPTGALRAAV